MRGGKLASALDNERHLGFGDQSRRLWRCGFGKSQDVRDEGAHVISGVKQKKIPYNALPASVHRGAQVPQFFDPIVEHRGPHLLGLWILAMEEVIPVAQGRCFERVTASEGPLDVKEPLQGGSK